MEIVRDSKSIMFEIEGDNFSNFVSVSVINDEQGYVTYKSSEGEKSVCYYEGIHSAECLLSLTFPLTLSFKDCATGSDVLNVIESLIEECLDFDGSQSGAEKIKKLVEIDDFIPDSTRQVLENLSDVSALHYIKHTYTDGHYRPLVKKYDFRDAADVYSGQADVSFGNRFSVSEDEQELIEEWIKRTDEKYEALESDQTSQFTYVWKIGGKEDFLDAISSLSQLADKVKEVEISASLVSVGSATGYRYSGNLWSIAGIAGCGYKTYFYDGERTRLYSSISTVKGVSEYANAMFAQGPMDVKCAGRRIKKGVELQPGDSVILRSSVYGKAPEFVEGQLSEKSPFSIKVYTSDKLLGNLNSDHNLSKCLALEVERAVAFVKELDPFTVTVCLLPDAESLDNKKDTLFHFKKNETKDSPKRFKKIKSFLNKYPDLVLAEENHT